MLARLQGSVEYDSDKHHARNKKRRISTTLRAQAFEASGWRVISITPDLMGNATAFGKIAEEIAEILQFPLPVDTTESRGARAKLRQHIVDDSFRYW